MNIPRADLVGHLVATGYQLRHVPPDSQAAYYWEHWALAAPGTPWPALLLAAANDFDLILFTMGGETLSVPVERSVSDAALLRMLNESHPAGRWHFLPETGE